ncbi:NADPH oxidase 3, partial [Linderina macrospora]
MYIGLIRKRQFEIFYYIHHLFLVIFAFLFVHHDNHLAYKYIAGPLALYVLDRLYRNLRSIFGKSPIRAVVQHPSGVVEIQMDKKIIGVRPGQYVKVYCPSVSMLQWHPLTISSAPEEELLTIHFRLEGNWTRRLAKRLGCNFGDDARSSSVQNVVSKTDGVDVFKFAKSEKTRPISQHLDIPYHPLHHDPTTVPMYSNAGGNSSYVSIDMVAKGGSASIRNSMVVGDDVEKEIARVSMYTSGHVDDKDGN